MRTQRRQVKGGHDGPTLKQVRVVAHLWGKVAGGVGWRVKGKLGQKLQAVDNWQGIVDRSWCKGQAVFLPFVAA